MMAVCERRVEAPLRPLPARRRAERLVTRLPSAEPLPSPRRRLWYVGAVSVVAHVVVLAALATVKLASATTAPRPLSVTLAGTVRILTDGEAADDGAGAGEVSVDNPVAAITGPNLVAMQQALPAMPEVRSPFADRGPVIAVEADLSPSGIRFVGGRGSETDAPPAPVSLRGAGGAGIAVLYSPRPVYPAAARSAGIEGLTVLRMEVRPNGSVGAVEVVTSSGHAELDEAAAAAVRRWKFVPLKVAGQPVVAQVEQAISFRLNRG